jgi:integrase
VIVAHEGGEWTEVGYEQWITRVWAPALKRVGIGYQRPYDLRHSFASLLLHEGRSVIYVARQLGHSAQLTMRTYGQRAARIASSALILGASSSSSIT